MMPDLEVGQPGERRGVGGDDGPARGDRGCGDHQVVRAARRSLAPNLHEESRMRLSNREVVGDHRDRGEHVLQERGPCGRLLPCSEQCTHPQLSDRDCGDGDIVRVGDRAIERIAGAVGDDEERRVQQEPSQDRSSISTN